jgi:SAM-dependent methyltransferase
MTQPALDSSVARAWIDRWDAQQQVYMPDREERFTALIDAVAESAGRTDPVILDLGCGPGSLAVRLLRELPDATVIAIDNDPLLLALGRAAHAGESGELSFAELNLAEPGWPARLNLDRPVDAAVSTTALHWLAPGDLAGLYAEVAQVLRPAGLLLNGDHLREDPAAPTLIKLGTALNEREERRRAPDGHAEDWRGWWQAVKAEPALAELIAERELKLTQSDHHGSPSGLLSTHVAALQAAGFSEIGTLWQRGDNRLLCAVR